MSSNRYISKWSMKKIFSLLHLGGYIYSVWLMATDTYPQILTKCNIYYNCWKCMCHQIGHITGNHTNFRFCHDHWICWIHWNPFREISINVIIPCCYNKCDFTKGENITNFFYEKSTNFTWQIQDSYPCRHFLSSLSKHTDFRLSQGSVEKQEFVHSKFSISKIMIILNKLSADSNSPIINYPRSKLRISWTTMHHPINI